MNDDKLELALWKMSVLGPLVSARLEHGDLAAWTLEIAERLHQRPDGRLVKLSPRTIQDWYYAYRRGGVTALARQTRADRGQTRSISDVVSDLVIRAKRERPRRSIRRIIRMLERARSSSPASSAAPACTGCSVRTGSLGGPSAGRPPNGARSWSSTPATCGSGTRCTDPR